MPNAEEKRPLTGIAIMPVLSPLPGAVEPFDLAVRFPRHQLDLAVAAADAGIEQIAELDFAGRGACLLDDDVELAARAEPRDGHAGRDASDDRLRLPWPARRRRAPSGRGSIRSRPGCAAAYGRSRSGWPSASSEAPTRGDLQPEVERARGSSAARAAAAAISRRAGRADSRARALDLAQRHRARDELADLGGIRLADARRAGATRDQRRRPNASLAVPSIIGRSGVSVSGDDELGRGHAVAGGRALGERRDRLRAGVVPSAPLSAGGDGAEDRGVEAGRQQHGQRAQADAGRGAAIPGRASRSARRDRAPDRGRRKSGA